MAIISASWGQALDWTHENVPSEEVTVHRSEFELVLGAQNCKTMANGLLDLGLEVWMFFQDFLVGVSTKLCMVHRILDFLLCSEASAHEAGSSSFKLGQFID